MRRYEKLLGLAREALDRGVSINMDRDLRTYLATPGGIEINLPVDEEGCRRALTLAIALTSTPRTPRVPS